jgi:hypothetical protein
MLKSLVIISLSITTTYAFNIEKSDVKTMLESMKSNGVLNEQQVKDADAKLQQMSDNEWDQIKDSGRSIASEYQEKNKKVKNSAPSAAQNIDFNSQDFKKIQDQVHQIMKNRK